MQPPSLLDHLLGNPLTVIALVGALLTLGFQYIGGAEHLIVPVMMLGFAVVWPDKARRRRAAWRAWNHEERRPIRAPRKPRKPLKGPLGLIVRLVKWTVILLVLVASVPFLWGFANSFAEEVGAGPLLSPTELASRMRVMMDAYGAWTIAALAGMAIFFGTFRFIHGRRRRASVKALVNRKWDGAVQVVLPVPKR